jgi:hypothetical protein
MEPRRIDLDALLNAHAFMQVERPASLWEVDGVVRLSTATR